MYEKTSDDVVIGKNCDINEDVVFNGAVRI